MHQRWFVDAPVVVLGDTQPSGVYVLRLHVQQPLVVACGRFKGGQPLLFPSGDYVYVGSALGVRGSSTLANRLLRHATRAADRPPQPLRATLVAHGDALGLGDNRALPRRPKKLFWHVDYVLNELTVELRQILALRTTRPLETTLAQLFEADPHTFIVESGLGAQDNPGHTHLLGVEADEAWWAGLVERLQRVLEAD